MRLGPILWTRSASFCDSSNGFLLFYSWQSASRSPTPTITPTITITITPFCLYSFILLSLSLSLRLLYPNPHPACTLTITHQTLRVLFSTYTQKYSYIQVKLKFWSVSWHERHKESVPNQLICNDEMRNMKKWSSGSGSGSATFLDKRSNLKVWFWHFGKMRWTLFEF